MDHYSNRKNERRQSKDMDVKMTIDNIINKDGCITNRFLKSGFEAQCGLFH